MNQAPVSREAVISELERRRSLDPDIHAGRLFGLVYPSGREDVEELIREVYESFLFHNALNPLRFPELNAIEREVIQMTADLLHRTPTERHAGSVTSGGTESILMSMLVNRARALARGITAPEILAPASAHPAYAKAGHYFGMKLVQIPLDENFRADVAAARELVNPNTAVIVANAYSYPHGAMDPIEELAALAAENGIACHVDACIGGFVLPFMERLGIEIPLWDFRVPGVTEISVDIHKYGFAPKGSSVILHRDDDWAWLQTYFYSEWGSGLYATPAIAGARAAAPVVASWAIMKYLGVDGFTEITATLVDATHRLRRALDAIDGIDVVGEPIGPLLALSSSTLDLFGVGDALEARGWHVNRNSDPKGLHLMLSPVHAPLIDELIADIRGAVANHQASTSDEVRYS